MSTALSWALLEERYGLTLMTPSAVGTTLSEVFERVVVILCTSYSLDGVVGNELVQMVSNIAGQDDRVIGLVNAHSFFVMMCYKRLWSCGTE